MESDLVEHEGGCSAVTLDVADYMLGAFRRFMKCADSVCLQ